MCALTLWQGDQSCSQGELQTRQGKTTKASGFRSPLAFNIYRLAALLATALSHLFWRALAANLCSRSLYACCISTFASEYGSASFVSRINIG